MRKWKRDIPFYERVVLYNDEFSHGLSSLLYFVRRYYEYRFPTVQVDVWELSLDCVVNFSFTYTFTRNKIRGPTLIK